MSRLGPNQLSARRVETLKDGVYSDGGNLWITVRGTAKVWSFRFKSPTTAKRREMGLGSARDIGLAKARELATAAREKVMNGIDPIYARKATEHARKIEEGQTFRIAAAQYISNRKAGWSDPRAEPIWNATLEQYVFPVIGDKPVASIDTEHVLAILQPIWATKTETGSRVRSRIHLILDFARAKGWRDGEKPARWEGRLAHMLPRPRSVAPVRHHPALPWRQIAAVMTKLGQAQGVAAQAVRFICLTATRSSEVRHALWPEFELERRLWIIPAARMKNKKEHRVPLAGAALEILERQATLNCDPTAYVFSGGRTGRPLSDVALSSCLQAAAKPEKVTVHGLRSTFRDWLSEATEFPNELGGNGPRPHSVERRGGRLSPGRHVREALEAGRGMG